MLSRSSQAAFAAVALASPSTNHPQRPDGDLTRLFDEFQEKHGQVANSAVPFENFKRYVALVDNHPTNPPLVSGAELSPLALLSVEEFEAHYRGCSKARDDSTVWIPNSGLTAIDVQNIESAFDWRDQGAVSPVKDQVQCGSCWAFSTTGLLESVWAVAGHGLQLLSEQELVSCDTADGNAGCDGGWPYLAVDYVRTHGISTMESYPYTSGGGDSGSCLKSSGTQASIQVNGFTIIESDESMMAAWLVKNGPVSISVDAMTDIWWPYTAGVISTCSGRDTDHAVLIVGYGAESNQQYWAVKNSWGQSWGEDGYIRLERGSNQCDITFQPIGAMVSGSPAPPPSPDGWVVYSDAYMYSSQQIDTQTMTIEDAKVHCAGLSDCVSFTIHDTAEATGATTVYFENGIDMVQSAGWTAFSKPAGPAPPTPPTPPTPTPPPTPPSPPPTPPSGACPPDAQEITSDQGTECLWEDGVGSFVMPPDAQEYCEYLSDGYFGYSWSNGDYDCAPSARKAGKFCTWEDGQKGVTIPSGASAECDKVSQGRIGLLIPRTTSILV